MHPMKQHYMLHQIKAKQFYTDLDLHQQCKSLQKKVFSSVFPDLRVFSELLKADFIFNDFL